MSNNVKEISKLYRLAREVIINNHFAFTTVQQLFSASVNSNETKGTKEGKGKRKVK